MIAAMLARGAIVGMIDRPDLYCYVVHGGNSFDSAHFNGLFASASQLFEFAAYDTALAQAPQFAFAEYRAELDRASA